jgi:hypothetical protein
MSHPAIGPYIPRKVQRAHIDNTIDQLQDAISAPLFVVTGLAMSALLLGGAAGFSVWWLNEEAQAETLIPFGLTIAVLSFGLEPLAARLWRQRAVERLAREFDIELSADSMQEGGA